MNRPAETIRKISDAESTNLGAAPGMRAGARAALQELARLRSRGFMACERFDAEVERIGRDNLEPCGCDLIVLRMGNSSPRFFIHTTATGKTCDLIAHFFHHEDSTTGSAEPGFRVIDGPDPSRHGVALTATLDPKKLVASAAPY